MLVQHDMTRSNPAWHLAKAVVSCSKDKSSTLFLCNKWIAAKVGR
jgi:hypothetical protein